MIRLIKVDLQRVLRDKLIWIACVIAVFFAVSTPLTYFLLFEVLGDALGDVGEMSEMLSGMGVSISAKSQFFTSFSLINNFGLIFPVLLAIVFSKDFGQGTMRNKIISGHSRNTVFFSAYTSCLITTLAVMLAQATLTMLVALIFFPFQDTPFFFTDLGYVLLSVLFECVLYAYVSAIVVAICMAVKNAGIAAVLTLAVILVAGMATSMLQMGEMLLGTMMTPTLSRVFDALQRIDVFGYSNLIGQGITYTVGEALCFGLLPLVGCASVLSLGAYVFRKSNLK